MEEETAKEASNLQRQITELQEQKQAMFHQIGGLLATPSWGPPAPPLVHVGAPTDDAATPLPGQLRQDSGKPATAQHSGGESWQGRCQETSKRLELALQENNQLKALLQDQQQS